MWDGNLVVILQPTHFSTAFRIWGMTEILTVTELAAMLKMSTGQVYEMTRARTRSGTMRDNPIPALKINGNVRFRKSDVEDWIEKLVHHGK